MHAVTAAGKKIAAARVRAKLTGKQLAAAAGVTASWVRSVETGHTQRPAPDKLARVAKVLGLDLRELLALTDQLGAAALVSEPQAVEGPADLSAVVRALADQTRAMQGLTSALEALFDEQIVRGQTSSLALSLLTRVLAPEGFDFGKGLQSAAADLDALRHGTTGAEVPPEEADELALLFARPSTGPMNPQLGRAQRRSKG